MSGEAAAAAEPKKWEERGWLMPYLLMGDRVFGVGRLTWWMDGIADGGLPKGDIPPLDLHHGSDTGIRDGLPEIPPGTKRKGGGPPLSAKGARTHLEDLVARMGSGWEGMLYIIHWLHWGLGLASSLTEAPKAPFDSDWGDMLYKDFQLGRLQAADSDVLGDILAERHGAGWNPNAFYPTPINVCKMMAEMTMGDDPGGHLEDPRLASVCDPCVGTGRMLLAASNHSLNLWGMDVDRVMVETCSINLALFAPWGVYIPKETAGLMGRARSYEYDVAAIHSMDEARVEQGHEAAAPKDTRVVFDRHGQGNLFSVIKKEEKL